MRITPEAVLIPPVNNKHCEQQPQGVLHRWKTDKLWSRCMSIAYKKNGVWTGFWQYILQYTFLLSFSKVQELKTELEKTQGDNWTQWEEREDMQLSAV